MEFIGKSFSLLAIVFLLLWLIYNILIPRLPQVPGDIYISKWGFKIYIPFVSAIIISVLMTFLLSFFKK